MRYCLIIYFLLTTLHLYSLEVKDFTYSHIGKDKGLDNQRIFSICQEKSGAIWWSSKAGIGRYNGSLVRNYSLKEGTPYHQLGGRVIHLTMTADTLYAFTNGGVIYRYNVLQDRFDPIADISKMEGHEVALSDLFVTAKGYYLAMHDGVYLLSNGTLTPLFKGYYVNKIIPFKGHLLFCTRKGVYSQQGKLLLTDNVESGFYDELSDKIWLGGYENGLHIVSLSDNFAVLSNNFAILEGNNHQNPIRSICPYDDNTMLIGIDGQGVYSMPRNGSGHGTLLFDANESAHGVLHGNGVYCMLVDQWQNILIGTYSGGIDIARPIGSITAAYKHIPHQFQSLLNDHVNMVTSLSDDLLVMGTDNGISMLDTRNNTWKHYCQGVVALHVCKKPDGGVLVSTYGKGIYEIDLHGNVRQLFTAEGGILKDDHVYATFYDRDGNLWIGCLNGDLIQLKGTEVRYYPIHDVQAISQLASGQMAIGTAFGLKLITPENGNIKELNYAPSGVTDVNLFVNHLLSRGIELWIATDGGGVYIYHQAKHESHQLTTANGLPSNHVSSLSLGKDGRIWIATEEGLAFVTPDEPNKVVNVNYCYGLDREYSRGAVANLSDGNIIFGSTWGAVIIHPSDIHPLNYTAHLQLHRVICDTEQDETFNEDVAHMLEDGKLRLDYSQRTFELHFESVNMRNHFDIVYRYKVGEDGEWSNPSAQQYIRFTNLEPGKHQLTLQCISRTSGIVIDSLPLTIFIAQPWWNSWWMWIIYLSIIFLLFYGAWRIYQFHEKYMRLTIDLLQQEKPVHENVLGEEYDKNLEADENSTDNDKEFVDKATHIIVENLSDSEFSIDRLCREMAMSRTLFYVKLKSYTGKSPQDFIRIIRLERASALLRSGRNVTDVAALTGFDNPKYFSTVFKKYFGISPSKYE